MMNPNESEGKERRKFERLMTDLPIRFTITEVGAEGSGPKSYGGRVINLSMDGLGVETYVSSEKEILRGKQNVDAEVSIPDSSEPLKITGEATWSTRIDNPSIKTTTLRFGIKISDISEPDREKLESYIRTSIAGSG